ncbi:MBL fold metallo-hydrolase [Candidatus Beckwithbacteria bacterium]|nr:MBL fold metallo-hydrolase [Candidatus Beckwithbacteria bacterium]
MQITYLGHSSFKIKTATATIVTDPFAKNVGLKFPKTEADIVTISHAHQNHDFREGIKNENAFIIDGPGEYEIKEVMIKGIRSKISKDEQATFDPNIIFQFETEGGLTLCHLGDLNRELTKKEIEELENTDILLIPVGNHQTIGAEMAKKIIKTLEPSIVIPMHYQQAGLAPEFAQLDSVETFLKEMEIEPKQEERLVINSTSLPEELEVVVLERKS